MYNDIELNTNKLMNKNKEAEIRNQPFCVFISGEK